MSDQMLIIVLCFISIIIFAGSHWFANKFGQRKDFAFLETKWLPTILEIFYFVGLPYLTLITGLLPARFFGLKGLEFFIIPDLGQPISAVIEALFVQAGNILFIWLPDFGSMASISTLLGLIFGLFLGFYLRAVRPARIAIYQSKVEVVFDVVHWAFYRAAIWLAVGSLYFGVLGGLVLILVEYTLANHFGGFSDLLEQQFLFRFGVGLLSSITFLFVPNLWLILIFQGIVVIIGEGMVKIFGNRKLAVV